MMEGQEQRKKCKKAQMEESETGEMKWKKRVGVGPREGRLEVKWMTMIGHTEC